MRPTEQEELKKLIMDCKSELLNHTLQGETVSLHIKKINSNLDSCLTILQKEQSGNISRTVGGRSPRITGGSRNNILFFAYCMSRFDTQFVNSILGRILNQTEAFKYLADTLNVKVATLRNYRDTFDSHVEQVRSSRQGWKKPLNDEFKFIIGKYDEKSEQDLLKVGKDILFDDAITQA
jgi:hypothetical protein